MPVEIGSNVKCTVIRVADYGAIVNLESGGSGLIHISQIADNYVCNVRDYLKENDVVFVKVLRLNEKGRYELSVKQCDVKGKTNVQTQAETAVASDKAQEMPRASSRSFAGHESFEQRLSKFMKDSEQRLLDLKRHTDGKRGRSHKK